MQALLVRACKSLADSVAAWAPSQETPALPLRTLLVDGGVGWGGGELYSITNVQCDLDPVCAAAIAGPDSPLMSKLAQMSLSTSGFLSSTWLLKVLAVALGHPPHLDQHLRSLVGDAVEIFGLLGAEGAEGSVSWQGQILLPSRIEALCNGNVYQALVRSKPDDAFCKALVIGSGLLGSACQAMMGTRISKLAKSKLTDVLGVAATEAGQSGQVDVLESLVVLMEQQAAICFKSTSSETVKALRSVCCWSHCITTWPCVPTMA